MRRLGCSLFFFSSLFIFFMFFSLFLPFSLFFFCAFYYKNTMDECRPKILMVLIFIMAIHQVIAQVISLQQVPITQHWSMTSVLLFFSEFVDMTPRVRSIRRY